ncbi:IS110 family transposase [Sphingobacterium sp. SGL-16]|uniref:IS110 family transposase n=1 Tax=Sphingobacterium sp. SGL-16 TaxID=2710883 RepID=UPI0013EACD7F|nr:transposase [Sphingobacterium sp. SGL-16]NGM73294.1 IS110 family transposase [Sphingobacterium sp. SGL-16]
MKTCSKFFIGIDISKPYFDASLLCVIDQQKQQIQTLRFENSIQGLKEFHKWLKKHKVTMNENTLLVIENTGIYHRLLWAFCCEKNLPIHIGNAAHIKWSFGIARGKSDRVDSIRLCQYAYRNAEELKSSSILDPVLLQIQDLMAYSTIFAVRFKFFRRQNLSLLYRFVFACVKLVLRTRTIAE